MDTMTGKTPTTVTKFSNDAIPFDFLRSTVKALGGESPRWAKNYYEFHGYTWSTSFEGIGAQRFGLRGGERGESAGRVHRDRRGHGRFGPAGQAGSARQRCRSLRRRVPARRRSSSTP